MAFTIGQLLVAMGPSQARSIDASTAIATLGLGSFATLSTLAPGYVTNGMLANMTAPTFKGRTTAGSGQPEDLTVTQATAMLNAMVGDSGSGGTKGLVPAPASGDAAASKFLGADGTWKIAGAGTVTNVTGTAPIVSSGGTTPAISINDATATVRGAVPTPPNDVTKFFNGLAAWSTPVIANLSGSVQASQMPALTGDVTTVAGAVATTIAANAVTNAKAAQMSANTIKGNNTGGTANAADLTAAQAKTLLAITESDVANLTTDLASKAPTSRLINTTAPITGGGDLTADRTIAISDATATVRGAVPTPPNDVTKFFRGDATWAVPPGGSSGKRWQRIFSV